MSSSLPRFTLRTDLNILNKIHYISEYNGRSANKEIEQLLKKHIDDFEKENGTIEIEYED